MSPHSKKSKGKNLLRHKCFHGPLCDKGMITGAQFIDYVRMVKTLQELEKEKQKDLNETFVKAINGELLSLTEADQDFLSGLKIDPETGRSS